MHQGTKETETTRASLELLYHISRELASALDLHTVLERLLEDISFEAADKDGSELAVDAAYVDEHLGELAKDEDLSRYIL